MSHYLLPENAVGISAVGVDGTSVHVVLEEALTTTPAAVPRADSDNSVQLSQLLVLSAHTHSALETQRSNLAAHLRQHPDLELPDIAYSLQTGRRASGHRCSIVCGDRANALSKLEGGSVHTGLARNDAPLVFMFPGQGAQYPEMGRGLYDSEAVFRAEFDCCADILQPLTGFDLREQLYRAQDRAEAAERLKATAVAQPAVFAVEYAAARLWMSWGLVPQAMIGHSVGEFVAAVLAEVFSLEDALALVAARGRLMQDLPGGAMLTVRLPEKEITALLTPALAIAAVNGPDLCVVSGPHAEIEKFEAALTARGAVSRRLYTSHAFHSPMVEPVIEPLRERLRAMRLSAPTIPYVSCVTGDWVRAEDATSPDYWAAHARRPVRFADGIATLLARGEPMLLEVGPGGTLAALALQAARGRDLAIVSCLPDAVCEAPDRECTLEALGRLWVAGADPDWAALHSAGRKRVVLPT